MEQTSLPAIWSASPCTIPYIQKAHSIDKSKRFQFNSIYYKDNPHKPKIKEDPFTRPQIILQEFRKKIKQATKSSHKDIRAKKKRSNGYDEYLDKFNTINIKADEVTRRLYEKPKSFLSLQHDLYGNRSSFFDQSKQNKNSSSPWKILEKGKKLLPNSNINVYITSTPRKDLSRPQNFNPGPGSYFLRDEIRYDSKSSMEGHSRSGSLIGSHSRSGSLVNQKNKEQFELQAKQMKHNEIVKKVKGLRNSFNNGQTGQLYGKRQ